MSQPLDSATPGRPPKVPFWAGKVCFMFLCEKNVPVDIHGKVRLQMVLGTLGILIFIMIPSFGDDIILSAAAVGPY